MSPPPNPSPDDLSGSSPGSSSPSAYRRTAARLTSPPQARRLQVRAAIATGLVALLASAALSVIAYERTRNTLLGSRDANARQQAYLNAKAIRVALQNPQANVGQIINTVSAGGTTTPLLRRPDGRWFARNAASKDELPLTLQDSAERGVFSRQRFEVRGEPRLGVVVPLRGPNGGLEATYVEVFSLLDVKDTLGALAAALALAAAIASIVGAIVGVMSSRRLVRPLRQLAAAANRIAGGDLRARLDPNADRALAPFIQSFNSMASALEERREQDSRFASNVSHEMRSPLAAMRNSLQLVLRRKEQMPERAALGATMLEEQIDRFERMVLDLLEIGRIDATSHELANELVDLGELVRTMAGVHPAGRGVAVQIGGHRDARLVEIDPRRFERVISNLLENAKRHAGGAEQVVVEPGGSVVHVHVDDTGPGVREEDRVRIFERFTRGPNARHGTGSGLGLALVTEQLTLMGGSIDVSNRPTGGARFTVTLPRTTP
jgi:two-component system, OmpR family, sensor histidine kinase MtrB